MMAELFIGATVKYSVEPNPLPPFAHGFEETETQRKIAKAQAETRVKFAMQTAIANLCLPIHVESIEVTFEKPTMAIHA